jgi:HflX C-terminal domain
VPVSALTGEGLKDLLTVVGEVVTAGMIAVRVVLPYDRGDLVETFHRRGMVTLERHDERGTLLEGKLPRAVLGLYTPYRPVPLRPGRAAHYPLAEDLAYAEAADDEDAADDRDGDALDAADMTDAEGGDRAGDVELAH